jgi:branched-chain amino acid transport system permease protein
MMGVLNFAHASFYMLGAYVAYSITQGGRASGRALLVATPAGGRCWVRCSSVTALRRVHKFGHVPELLITFGLAYVILRAGAGPGAAGGEVPAAGVLRGPRVHHRRRGGACSVRCGRPVRAVTPRCSACSPFPSTRGFMMVVARSCMLALWLLLTRTRIGL